MESKDKIKNKIETDSENRLLVGLGAKSEGMKKYKLVVIEQSQRYKLQHREYSQ